MTQPKDLLRDTPASLSGLDALRKALANAHNAPIADTLGFRMVAVSEGEAVFESTPTSAVYNPIGSVHGGFSAAILDSACGCAVHTVLSGSQGYTTLELKIAYHRAINLQSGKLRCVGRVQTAGKRVAFATAEIHDEAGKLCASATSTLLVFDLPKREPQSSE